MPDRTPPATKPPVETPPPGGPRVDAVPPAVVPVAAVAAPRADVAVTSSPSLAKTGFDLEPVLLTGLGSLAAGGAAVYAGTRRRRDA
ncbi:LPXTG cell wall anchor domain-containing protein [Amycolatopsis japonica]|uniref:LPXTG cell wall anchor domain-containing protein n=1 Tax=Amycolatopsis japonica TaxID=208439 RepID=UPI0033215747